MNNMDFKPCYVWPNPAFPFRVYFESDKLRIFLIENIQHNFLWLKEYREKIRYSDIFFVIIGCHYSEALVAEAAVTIKNLEISFEQFYILYNDERERILFESHGFSGEIINQNAWLDYRHGMRPLNVEKMYRAVYTARLSPVKRHYLANKVTDLALIVGDNYSSTTVSPPPHIYLNTSTLDSSDVCTIINRSYVGLILSEYEGACFASSEYLLCGIPVVSTENEGGRSIWYDDYNSLIVSADPESVANAVDFFVNNPRDSHLIMSAHVEKQEYFRSRFIVMLQRYFNDFGHSNIDAVNYFRKNYYNKMRTAVTPKFEEIFS